MKVHTVLEKKRAAEMTEMIHNMASMTMLVFYTKLYKQIIFK